MATSHSNSRSFLLLILTSGFFITGILFDYMPIIIDNQIKRNIELATNEEIQGIWAKPPIDINSYYWLYNITNPEQFMKGDKIKVKKVGPYHFTSRAEKRIIELSANKYRIIYNATRHIRFNESKHELSYEQWKNSLTSNTNAGSILTKIDDNLTIINAAFITMIEAARELASKDDTQTNQMLIASSNRLAEKFNETLILNMTARQALMGRKLIFVEKARRMIETFGIENKLPNTLKNDIFGYVAIMNETNSGPFEIYTGYQASMSSLGDIISYQGKRRYSEYRGKCGRLQASAGELRPMPIMDGQILEMSVPGFCRIIKLLPTGIKKLREGLAIGYTHNPGDFKNSTYYPENECFCVNGTVDNYCSLNGAIELAPCAYYSPLVLTTSAIEPDQRIISTIAEFEPELLLGDVDTVPKADDQAQLLILKRIGVPVKADLTYTLFGKVIRDPKFRQTASVPEVSYIPLVMIREMASIPAELGQIVVNLENLLTLTQHMKVIMYLSSIVLLCWLTGHYYTRASPQDRVVPSNGSWRHSTNPLGQTNDSLAPSDRANSADSSRSQPPSRMASRAGSIDINESGAGGGRSLSATSASTNQVTLDSEVSQRQQKKVVSSSNKKILFNQKKALHQISDNLGCSSRDGTAVMVSSRNSNNDTAGTDTETINDGNCNQQDQDIRSPSKRLQTTRFFSKVEEELELKRGRQERLKGVLNDSMRQGQSSSSTINQRQTDASLSEKKTNTVNAGDIKGLNRNENNKTKTGSFGNGESENDNQPARQVNTQIRKSWFMKVCSNLARILSGIRGTISEASQLDIRDNDYHDKQLEMLAGKIDNWYNSTNANTTTTTTASSSPEKDDVVVSESNSENNGLVDRVHDRNTNDSELKSSGLAGKAVEIELKDNKKVDSNSRLANQANKAQVNKSESSNKITASEVEEDKRAVAPRGNDDKVMEVKEEDKSEAEVTEEKQKVSSESSAEKENEQKDDCKEENERGEDEEEQQESDEKAKLSQTGSLRRERTIKKKTLAIDRTSDGGFEPLNGNSFHSTPATPATPGELAGNENVVDDTEFNLIKTTIARTDEKTDGDDTKIDQKLPPDQIDAPSKVSFQGTLRQCDSSNAKLPNGSAGAVVLTSGAQVNPAQNSATTIEDEDLEAEIGEEEGDEDEEEEEEEEESSKSGLAFRNGTCIETNHFDRTDSVQSNQRITNKSDTSGDESTEAASLVSVKQIKEDKAAAFEQIEMAMAIAQ